MAEDPAVIGEAFNFSTETPMSVLELVAALQKAAGTSLELDIRATATHEIDSQFLSAAKARKILGWEPTVSVDDALAMTIAWYREHGAAALT
jgi:CDP-glucose 4,6-dehydratase